MSSHLSEYDRSIARAFQKMNEESLRWLLIFKRFSSATYKIDILFLKYRVGVIHRFRHGNPEDAGFNYVIFKIAGSKMLKEADAQGELKLK